MNVTATNFAANVLTLTQNGLARATTYYCRLKAINASGASAWVYYTQRTA